MYHRLCFIESLVNSNNLKVFLYFIPLSNHSATKSSNIAAKSLNIVANLSNIAAISSNIAAKSSNNAAKLSNIAAKLSNIAAKSSNDAAKSSKIVAESFCLFNFSETTPFQSPFSPLQCVPLCKFYFWQVGGIWWHNLNLRWRITA